MLPPYEASPWLGMGLVLVGGLLEEAGIGARALRFLDDPTDTPADVMDAAARTAWSSPPMDDRLARIEALARRHAGWFDALLDRLAAVPEPVLGLSVWRHNADVTLTLTRRLKERRPDLLVVLGGPEAVTFAGDLQQPWVDAVASRRAESVAVPLFRAALAGRLGEVSLEGVWVNPRHGTPPAAPPPRLDSPRIPPIDYTRHVALVRGTPAPDVPFLLSLGCPFRCVFCSNTNLYPDLQFREAARVAAEMDQAVRAWQALHAGGPAPHLSLTLCDAAANAWPAQFDALCDAIAAARWTTSTALQAMIIIDGRITPARVVKYLAAGLTRPFFGLETASERLRRRVKKPGRADEVARALETIGAVGGGRMQVSVNVIVGFPEETEADYRETLDFMDWAIDLGVISELGVMPLMRMPDAMDQGLLATAEGPTRGYDWRTPTPGGDPRVRARRFLGVFERFGGRLVVSSPIPREHLIRRLLPELGDDEVEAWLDRHGRVSTYFGAPTAPAGDPVRQAGLSAGDDGEAAPDVAGEHGLKLLLGELLRQVEASGGLDGWRLHELVPAGDGAVALFAREGALQAVDIEPDVAERRALVRAAGFALGYRGQWQGRACEARPEWVRGLAARLEALLGGGGGAQSTR